MKNFAAALIFAVLVLSSCKPKPQTPQADIPASPRTDTQAAARETQAPIQVSFKAEQVSGGEEPQVNLIANVTDRAGSPLKDAKVHATLTMAGMSDHVEADLQPQPNGAYQASAKLSMPGKWQAKITAQRENFTTDHTDSFIAK